MQEQQLFNLPTDKEVARQELNPFLSKINPTVVWKIKEISEMLYCSDSKVKRLIDDGILKAICLNPNGKTKRYSIPKEYFEQFIKKWVEKHGVKDD